MTPNTCSNQLAGRVYFIEAAQTGSGLLHIQWAMDNGFDAWLLTTEPKKYARVPGSEALLELARRERVIVCETTEGTVVPEALTRSCAQHTGAAGVVCVSDRHLVFAAAFAAEIGAASTSVAAIECLRDKRQARALFDALELPTARWCAPACVDDVASFASAVNAPIVIKNCRGTGSLDVKLCSTVSDAVQNYHAMSIAPRYLDGDLMLEEYLYGPLLSIEVLVSDGHCIELGATDRQLGPLPNFCEVSYTFPVLLPKAVAAAMLDTVQTLASHLQIAQGFLHVEFIVTGDGPKLVEVNPRLGGGLLAHMMSDCLTVPVSKLLTLSALGALDAIPEQNGKTSSTVTVYPSRKCRLRSLKGLEQVAASPFVCQIVPLAAPGDEIMPAQDYRGAVCQIRTVADSATLAFNGAQMAAQFVLSDLEQESN